MTTMTRAAAYAALEILRESPHGYREYDADQCAPYVRKHLWKSATARHEEQAALRTVDLLQGDLSALEGLSTDIGEYLGPVPGPTSSGIKMYAQGGKRGSIALRMHRQRQAA